MRQALLHLSLSNCCAVGEMKLSSHTAGFHNAKHTLGPYTGFDSAVSQAPWFQCKTAEFFGVKAVKYMVVVIYLLCF